MIEVFNRLLKDVLRKKKFTAEWNEHLFAAAKAFNNRVISYLKMSPVSINFDDLKENSHITAIVATEGH